MVIYMVIYMVICVDNSHLGALQKTPDPSWLAEAVALTVPGSQHINSEAGGEEFRTMSPCGRVLSKASSRILSL